MNWQLIVSSLVGGVVNGGVLAFLVFGLAVIYKATGVLNVAQGAIATLAAFVAAVYVLPRGAPVVLLLLVAALVGGAAATAIDVCVARPLRGAPSWTMVVATLAVALLIDNVVQQLWGDRDRTFPAAVGDDRYRFWLVSVSRQQILVLAATATLVAASTWFFRRTRAGLAMRAVASDHVGAEIVGIRTRRLQMAAWFAGGMIAGIAGFLVAPMTFVTPGMMQGYLFRMLAASVLAGLDSLTGAVVGAFVFSVVVELAPVWVGPEFHSLIPLLAVMVALAFKPNGVAAAEPERVV